MIVDFLFGLGKWGDVAVTADVSLGRPAPLACSEASYLDPGDPTSVEIISVHSWDEHERKIDLMECLTPKELETVKISAVDEALRLEWNES